MFRISRLIVPIVAFVVGTLLLTACGGTNKEIQKQRKEAVQQRSQTFARASAAVPVPKTTNFPIRKALAEFTARQDKVGHPWYIYLLGDNGNQLGYYVAKTVPVNACDFLSSTEVVDSSSNGKVILTAPSLDGVYYGGAGGSNACDAWFFFDYATNALIQIRGLKFITADAPLKVQSAPISVKGTP